jgi:hypothetical protein
VSTNSPGFSNSTMEFHWTSNGHYCTVLPKEAVMCKESPRIPVDQDTEEVRVVQSHDGRVELVLVDHAGVEQVVPVALKPVACERRAT